MDAAAFVVGSAEGQAAGLLDLARLLDFSAVFRFGGTAAAEAQALETPIVFFLFAPVTEPSMLAPTAEAIRFSNKTAIRFAPMIYFAENPGADTIGRCIDLGFDDVITMPAPRARILGRLERQIGRKLVFHNTADYFGPERRKSGAPSSTVSSRGRAQRIEIIRHIESGIDLSAGDASLQRAG